MFKSGERCAAHGVDVAQSVCGGNASEVIRIVHYRREKVRREHERLVVGKTVDGCVVSRVGAEDHPGVVDGRKRAQNLR